MHRPPAEERKRKGVQTLWYRLHTLTFHLTGQFIKLQEVIKTDFFYSTATVSQEWDLTKASTCH